MVNSTGQKVLHTEPVGYLVTSHSSFGRVEHHFLSCSWEKHGDRNERVVTATHSFCDDCKDFLVKIMNLGEKSQTSHSRGIDKLVGVSISLMDPEYFYGLGDPYFKERRNYRKILLMGNNTMTKTGQRTLGEL